jgi:hypothetical protein
MSGTSHLELRALPIVAVTYLLAPLIALTGYWAAVALPHWTNPEVDRHQLVALWLLIAVWGGAVCLFLEFIFVTPLLIGFHRFRWRWLNGWTGALIGFGLGALPWLFFGILSVEPGSGASANGVILVEDGHRTLEGWRALLRQAGGFGLIGVGSALVFRLCAVRRATDA